MFHLSYQTSLVGIYFLYFFKANRSEVLLSPKDIA